jgi:hypothetical protein
VGAPATNAHHHFFFGGVAGAPLPGWLGFAGFWAGAPGLGAGVPGLPGVVDVGVVAGFFGVFMGTRSFKGIIGARGARAGTPGASAGAGDQLEMVVTRSA